MEALKEVERKEGQIDNVRYLVEHIVKKEDFCTINGKIEITRDLALKLFASGKLNYETEIQPAITNDNEIVFIVKAKVYKDNSKVAEGLGACSTSEVKGSRAYHDALARAETRAFKRALEACIGLPFINQIIEKLFNGYEEKPQAEPEQEQEQGIEPDEIIAKIREAKHLNHLKNIWTKYNHIIKTFDNQTMKEVIKAKEIKKRELEA